MYAAVLNDLNLRSIFNIARTIDGPTYAHSFSNGDERFPFELVWKTTCNFIVKTT